MAHLSKQKHRFSLRPLQSMIIFHRNENRKSDVFGEFKRFGLSESAATWQRRIYQMNASYA